jgi:type III restriction enzyme
MPRDCFASFLRNIPRRDGRALCVPYGAENDQAFFPDLLIFRRFKNGVSIDILEPHGDQFADHLSKAQRLARYAKEHGEGFGRIEMIRLVKGKPERLDMQDERFRGRVLKATTAEQLQDLYEEMEGIPSDPVPIVPQDAAAGIKSLQRRLSTGSIVRRSRTIDGPATATV